MSKPSKLLKILIVEDDPVDQRMLESMLTKNSSTVLIADSISKALEILSNNSFDVIILDLNLPDSKGKNTLKLLNDKAPQTAIVVNTGAYEDNIGINTLTMGAQDFLVKSKYSADALLKTLYFAIERKRLELELKNAYQTLQNMQTQMIESEKMRVVGGLASGVAHEVKNPLAIITYATAYLLQVIKDKDENIQLALKNMDEASKRADSIITSLLDFSSINVLKKTDENINDLIQTSLSFTKYDINKYKIIVKTDLSLDIPKIKIDKNKVEQVLINLILNSVYAMPNGGEILIRTDWQKVSNIFSELPDFIKDTINKKETFVRVVISDKGTGIPQEIINNIFDPFFTTRRTKGGFGLGLSISKNIIENHKGRIFIENNPEGGAKATLLFNV